MSKHSKFRFPMPVYVATLASGEVVRISFGSPVGKPLDVARGRHCAAYQCGEEGAYPDSTLVLPAGHAWPVYETLPGVYSSSTDGPCCPVSSYMTPVSSWSGGWRPLPPKILAEIVSGEVEYNGETYADPMTDGYSIWPEGETPKKAPRAAGQSAAALRDATREIEKLRGALVDVMTFGAMDSPLEPIALARIAAAALGVEMTAVLRLAA